MGADGRRYPFLITGVNYARKTVIDIYSSCRNGDRLADDYVGRDDYFTPKTGRLFSTHGHHGLRRFFKFL